MRRWTAAIVGATFGGSLAACLLGTLDGLDSGNRAPADAAARDVDAGASGPADANGGPVDAGGEDVVTHDAAPPTDAGCLVGSYTGSVLADAPVSYWRLDEASGATVAKDTMGRADGTYQGGVTAGAPGLFADDTAASFDGSSGMIVVGPTPAFDGKAPFTLEAWTFATKIDSVYRGIASNETTTVDSRGGFLLYAHASSTGNDVGFERWANGSSNPTITDAGMTNAWMHVVGTFDGATLRFFLDGMQMDEDAADIVAVPQPYTFVIGALFSGAVSSSFSGKIDEVAVYDHALDPRCVLAHYHLGLGQAP